VNSADSIARHRRSAGSTTAARPCVRITACRACGAGGLHDLLAFGEVPLANALRPRQGADAPELRFPLTLALCPDCTLVQLRETVTPRLLFGDYPYFSSYATSTLAYADQLAADAIARFGLSATSRVIEVGSNDGYLLLPFLARGIGVLGIEPAANVAAVARTRGVPTETMFFGLAEAHRLAARGQTADLIVANNVLAHVADLPGFVAGLAKLLRPGGHVLCEFPYLGDLLADGEFDTIYHEHLCYFSLLAVHRLFARHGLHVVAVERLARHGGSLRVTAAQNPPAVADAAVTALLATENRARYDEPAAYAPFVAHTHRIRDDLQRFLADCQRAGRTVAAYGAAAKGSTLMQFCGITREQVLFVADRSPHKQGRCMPGNHVPIVALEQILAAQPDHLLLLAWNFQDEIITQQAEYRRRGGTFVVPIPELRLL